LKVATKVATVATMSKNTRAHLEGMTVADFKEHIRQISKPEPAPKGPCVRTPEDYGYKPTPTKPEGE
jgi:hypothetical protein